MSVIPQPASAPAPESTPSTGGTTAPPPSPEAQLKAIFAAQYDEQESTFESVLSTTAAELKAAKDVAASEFESVPQVLHTEEQRTAMGGKRYPGLSTATRLMAEGLVRHPEIVAATLVTPELALGVVAQDDAATQLAVAGDSISKGADDGSILVSATTETLCQRTLAQVQQTRTDPRTPEDQRSDLRTAFTQAERLRSDRLQRLQAAKAQTQQSTQGQAQQADQAQQTAAETRLIDAFDAVTKNK